MYQTVLRGEITAAIAACRYGLSVKQKFSIWTDNSLVHKRLRSFLRHDTKPPKAKHNDHDLWNELFRLVQRAKAGCLIQHVVKVTSHQTQDFSETIEDWARRGNDHADRIAGMALYQLPTKLQCCRACIRSSMDKRQHACQQPALPPDAGQFWASMC